MCLETCFSAWSTFCMLPSHFSVIQNWKLMVVLVIKVIAELICQYVS